MVRQLIGDPGAFMERKVGEAHIRVEILIVLLVGALSSPGILYVMLLALEQSETAQMRFAATGQVIRPLVYILVLWAVYSLACHFIASHYRGRGAPRRLFKGIAWAFLPIGLGNLVKSAALYLVYRDESPEEITEMMSGFMTSEQVDSLFASGMSDPIMIAALVIFAGTVLWSGYLMTFAVAEAKNIDRDKAIRVVAIPILLHLVLVVMAIVQESPNFAVFLTLR